jgi:site-specific recombinase XerC
MAETTLPTSAERLTFWGGATSNTSKRSCNASARLQDYRIILLRHLGPFFGSAEASQLTADDVGRYIAAKRRSGLAVKTITNHLNFAHGVFAFGIRRGWVVRNPVAMADRPVSPPADPDIRFLDREELEALLRAEADDLLGPTDRVLWLTAAMTGLRQG